MLLLLSVFSMFFMQKGMIYKLKGKFARLQLMTEKKFQQVSDVDVLSPGSPPAGGICQIP